MPKLGLIPETKRILQVFRGYDHNPKVPEGAFYHMENLSSRCYPILAPRKPRGFVHKARGLGGLIAKDTLCWVENGDFVVGGYHVDMKLSEGKKQLVSMGAYVIILPDKRYINTANLSDHGNIEAEFPAKTPISCSLCRSDGTPVQPDFCQENAPEEPENMQFWLDTAESPHSLKQWSAVSQVWVVIDSTFVKLSAPGIGRDFSKFDGITISGMAQAQTEDLPDNAQLAALEGSNVIWDKGEDHIVVTGILDGDCTVTGSVTIARRMPEMDFLIESENRLWGCRYGVAANGQIVNELYACKQGDFKNWSCYMGLATDSYAASLGSDGPFTGAVTHLGYPLFFKENYLHKVYGTRPENFQIQTTACRGVQRGCGGSLAVVGEVLYYKSRHGVCAYDGALPVEVSRELGDIAYDSAHAGPWGSKYYISMRAFSDGKFHLFVYDTHKKLWHREDSLRAESFCPCRGELYCIDRKRSRILALGGSQGEREEKLSWCAETGILGPGDTDARYIARLVLRLFLDAGASVECFLEYDSSGIWESVGVLYGNRPQRLSLPVRPRRCRHFRLRLKGHGDARLYAITQTLQKGSDRV